MNNLRLQEPIGQNSYLRFHNRKLLIAENEEDYIGDPDDFALSYRDASNLYGAHKVIDDKYVFTDDLVTNFMDDNPNESTKKPNIEYIDEPNNSAGVDQTMPSDDLLNYIKHMANIKLSKRQKNYKNSYKTHPLTESLSESALISTGIFVEELFRDFMKTWRKNGHPLEKTPKNIKSQSITQLKGSNPNLISGELLRNRLDIFFGKAEMNDNITSSSSSSSSSSQSKSNSIKDIDKRYTEITDKIINDFRKEYNDSQKKSKTDELRKSVEELNSSNNNDLSWSNFEKCLKSRKPKILSSLQLDMPIRKRYNDIDYHFPKKQCLQSVHSDSQIHGINYIDDDTSTE